MLIIILILFSCTTYELFTYHRLKNAELNNKKYVLKNDKKMLLQIVFYNFLDFLVNASRT